MDYLLVLFDIWALAFLLSSRKTLKGILDVGGFTSSPKVYTVGQLRPPVRAMKWIVTGALRQTIEFLANFCLHPNKSRCCKCIHSRFPSAFSLKSQILLLLPNYVFWSWFVPYMVSLSRQRLAVETRLKSWAVYNVLRCCSKKLSWPARAYN